VFYCSKAVLQASDPAAALRECLKDDAAAAGQKPRAKGAKKAAASGAGEAAAMAAAALLAAGGPGALQVCRHSALPFS
jgi:hypothetical protein